LIRIWRDLPLMVSPKTLLCLDHNLQSANVTPITLKNGLTIDLSKMAMMRRMKKRLSEIVKPILPKAHQPFQAVQAFKMHKRM
jgi:hypothetical protein